MQVRRSMFKVSLALGLVLAFGATASGANAPAQSMRPMARSVEPVQASFVVPTLRTSLRPQARPARAPQLSPQSQEQAQVQTVQASAADAGFQRWISGFKRRASAQGISQTTLDDAFRNVRYNAGVIKKDRNQSEFTKQIWDYLDSAASPTRVKNGKAALRKYGRVLQEIENRYGVEKEVVAAVWGLESAYGAHRGDTPLIEAVSTLAYDGRRGKFFEAQLVAALKIIQNGDVSARNMTGSWAGAMGHTQFIPTSYEAFAVDFRGDGKRDIWSDDPTDALASTAAYLAKSGWRKGMPWGVEVRLPRGFDYSSARRNNRQLPSAWAKQGVVDVQGRAVRDFGSASILLPAGAQGAAFMIFSNFAAIEKYNKADAYVIGVGHLSDRLKGGPEIQASWPRGYKPLSFKDKQRMQRILTRKGFDTDGVDGIIGPNTINAIRAFQKSRGVTPDGFPSEALMKLLRG
ncbi:lytic murein transglycosylase [Algirhabdus cladophorae]|uniref:lytic murein transglycosylase n=1 Tax=Algirhabdus cladophorae TaxID=3377108 RepID=UPI003B846123